MALLAAGLCLAGTAAASPAGERHLTITEDSARARDAQHRDQLRVTVWYPAAADAREQPLDIGPPGHPLFTPGSAAPDAGFSDDRPHPVVLLSHGFGGSARIMAWFGTALARAGYIVVAPDHPGNNARDPMTIPGSAFFWERPGDLAAALSAAKTDPAIGPHLDTSRLGVAGFSAGGFTSLAAAGGRVDLPKFRAFCETHPADGICAPQKEFPIAFSALEAFLDRQEAASDIAKSHGDLGIKGIRAAFVMAPALVQSFDPASLNHIGVPVSIILGDADVTAPPATNGEIAAKLIPGAQLYVLHDVGHYDFLAECGADGIAHLEPCRSRVSRQQTHQTTSDRALAFFGKTLR